MYVKRNCIWNPATCSLKKWKYLTTIVDNSAITCDKVRESYDKETKTIPANMNKKKAIYKTQNFYILFAFLLITIELLIAVSIYCYLIKNRALQKDFLPFHKTNKKLKELNSVNPLYPTFNKVNGYFEEINGNKYLTLVATNESKEKVKKFEEL